MSGVQVTKHENIPYTAKAGTIAAVSTDDSSNSSAPAAGVRQTLDLFVVAQQGNNKQALLPLIVYIHGGLWVDRDKSHYRALAAHWSSTLSSHVALLNYRQSNSKSDAADASRILHPHHTEDIVQALQWLCEPHTQQEYKYKFSDLYLVGHSCGAHMVGLATLSVPGASLLSSSLLSSSRSAFLPYLRGLVGIEGIFDNARFVADFPDWASGITDAFGKDASRWESPQDFLTSVEAAASSGTSKPDRASRQRIDDLLRTKNLPAPQLSVPWLVIHSKEDPWVNLPQAENFHAAVLAHDKANESSASSSSSADKSKLPPSTLVLINGAHFEVIEQIGGPNDQITKPLQEFIEKTKRASTV